MIQVVSNFPQSAILLYWCSNEQKEMALMADSQQQLIDSAFIIPSAVVSNSVMLEGPSGYF